MKVERDVAQMDGELIPDPGEACLLVVGQAFKKFWAGVLWVVGRGQSIVGHGDNIVVQGGMSVA